MSAPSTTANDVPTDIWEEIALYVAASSENILGPPTDTCSLPLVSRAFYHKLSWTQNRHLYGRIFRLKFDTSALGRRLSDRWATSQCLASELIKRFQAMRRIKAGQFEVDDLWTVYLMLLENDGRNAAQLYEYARLEDYVQALMVSRVTTATLPWFRNPTVDSLLLWLTWFTSDRERLRTEQRAYRQYLVGVLQSIIVAGYRYPSVHAPDLYFYLPLCEHENPPDIPGMITPPLADITHYSKPLRLSAPLISTATILGLSARFDAARDESNLPQPPIPRTRLEAAAQGWRGPTMEDVRDFHLGNHIPLPRRTQVLSSDQAPVTPSPSETYDQDWYRHVSCHDPHDGDSPLRGTVYRPGSLSGSWAGRILQVDYDLYTSILNSSTTTSTISVRHDAMYWDLEEHHCLEPNDPLPSGSDGELGDGILNAWMPKDHEITHTDGGIEVYDSNTGHTARYETIGRDSKSSGKCQKTGFCDDTGGASSDRSREPAGGASSMAVDDDEYEDTVSYTASGVNDILITGKTTPRYSQAWGNYTIYGRVRSWDGLVVLLRHPTNPLHRHMGRWIFKGYLHDGKLVGRWRETSTPVDMVGYEGGFVMYQSEPVESS